MFSWNSFRRPIVALAPMAGYTDSPYRQLVKSICPSVVCFTEFTSVDGILHGNEATMRQMMFDPEKERPIVAQIFGKKPENFAKATRVLTQLGVDAIDINMGCPAKKIISSDHGSALLKNPSLSEEIVAATAGATHLPVSIKMRVGTSCYDADFFIRFGQKMVKAGAQLITVHGRTSRQMYSGKADWNPIYELKKIVNVPVIGNGDIQSAADAREKIGNLDGVMIGRGSFGNPWVFCEILAAFEGRNYIPPTIDGKIAAIKQHIDISCAFKGEKWGILEMRKHIAWYIRGVPHAGELRAKLMCASSRDEVMRLVSAFSDATH